jgi:hypothetical protein
LIPGRGSVSPKILSTSENPNPLFPSPPLDGRGQGEGGRMALRIFFVDARDNNRMELETVGIKLGRERYETFG